jgi:hypothetical protein
MTSCNIANFYRLAALVAAMLVFTANVFADDKYIPSVSISISDDDGLSWTSNTGNNYTLEVGKSVSLRIVVAIETKGVFTGNKIIPFYVAFSSGGDFILTDFADRVEPTQVGYSFMTLASKKPNVASIIFQCIAVSAGTQTITLSYDDEISRRYDQTVTLRYVNK